MTHKQEVYRLSALPNGAYSGTPGKLASITITTYKRRKTIHKTWYQITRNFHYSERNFHYPKFGGFMCSVPTAYSPLRLKKNKRELEQILHAKKASLQIVF